eukprot:30925-Pelagococcus_subviridis.AAC.15
MDLARERRRKNAEDGDETRARTTFSVACHAARPTCSYVFAPARRDAMRRGAEDRRRDARAFGSDGPGREESFHHSAAGGAASSRVADRATATCHVH